MKVARASTAKRAIVDLSLMTSMLFIKRADTDSASPAIGFENIDTTAVAQKLLDSCLKLDSSAPLIVAIFLVL